MPLLVSFYWTWEISPLGLSCQSIALGVYDYCLQRTYEGAVVLLQKNVGEAETRESHQLVFSGEDRRRRDHLYHTYIYYSCLYQLVNPPLVQLVWHCYSGALSVVKCKDANRETTCCNRSAKIEIFGKRCVQIGFTAM